MIQGTKGKAFLLRSYNLKNVYETQAIQRNENKLELSLRSSSEQEHKVNALAQGAEEGRDKLRKAAGSCK